MAALLPGQMQALARVDLGFQTPKEKLQALRSLRDIEVSKLLTWTHWVRGPGLNERVELSPYGLNVLRLCSFALLLPSFAPVR